MRRVAYGLACWGSIRAADTPQSILGDIARGDPDIYFIGEEALEDFDGSVDYEPAFLRFESTPADVIVMKRGDQVTAHCPYSPNPHIPVSGFELFKPDEALRLAVEIGGQMPLSQLGGFNQEPETDVAVLQIWESMGSPEGVQKLQEDLLRSANRPDKGDTFGALARRLDEIFPSNPEVVYLCLPFSMVKRPESCFTISSLMQRRFDQGKIPLCPQQYLTPALLEDNRTWVESMARGMIDACSSVEVIGNEITPDMYRMLNYAKEKGVPFRIHTEKDPVTRADCER